jgi:prepilin peptidase CpaA
MTPSLAIAVVLGAAATVEDLRRRTLPNWLTVGGIAAGLLLAAPHGWHALGISAAGASLGFAILLPFFCLRGMGGGDIKLMAAFGALLGPSSILLAAVLAGIFGALLAIAVLLARPRTAAIPYAPAITLGAWLSFFT